jgi:hypothetical protein
MLLSGFSLVSLLVHVSCYTRIPKAEIHIQNIARLLYLLSRFSLVSLLVSCYTRIPKAEIHIQNIARLFAHLDLLCFQNEKEKIWFADLVEQSIHWTQDSVRQKRCAKLLLRSQVCMLIISIDVKPVLVLCFI